MRAWIVVLVVGAGTFAIRFSFLFFARRLTELPELLETVLRMIPAAVLAAIVAPLLLRPDGPIVVMQPRLLAGAFAALVAWRTRSMLWTLVLGMAALIVLEATAFA